LAIDFTYIDRGKFTVLFIARHDHGERNQKENRVPLLRRQFLRLAAAAVVVPAAPRILRAQSYPTHPVRLIVPFAAGGPTDVIVRLIAQKLSERWGHHFIVENIPTGASNVGIAVAAKAPSDGYTLVVVTTGFVINPSLYARLSSDPIKDFAPVTLMADSPHVLVVHPAFPASSVRELVELVKAKPGKYAYASPGTGQSGQLAAELFKSTVGIDLVHVPFNGAAPAIISTIGGHTPIAFVALPSAAANIKDGTLRALAVTSSKRSVAFPDVPTMAEAGISDQESAFIEGILFPAGTPKEIIELWYREVARIVELPDVKERLTAMSFEPVASTPEEFGTWIKTEIPRWAKIIRNANINPLE
jgi:tripartite-type tricarboxylate transporter receptor subunit TctC